MRAVLAHQPERAVGLAEKDQLLAEDFDPPHGPIVGQLTREGHWMPVTSEQLAAGRAWSDLGQQRVFFLREHGPSPLNRARPAARALARRASRPLVRRFLATVMAVYRWARHA